MKKIGLVTWYDRGPNYGTSLQAYALQNYIEKLGHQCDVINYEYRNLNQRLKRKILNVYILIFNRKVYLKHRKINNWIKNNIKISPRKYNSNTLADLDNIYDAFVCGSDQIWSTAEEYIDPFYYLQFTGKDKRISYAPSVGKNIIGKTVENEFKKYVSEIDYLSVREEKGAELIYKLTNKKPKIVLDPTLLFSKNEWIKILKLQEKKNNQKYIFCYFLRENSDYYKMVSDLAKRYNLQIVCPPELYSTCGDTKIMNSKEFLESILNAEFVATDSFHGLAFSIIFQKRFCVFKRYNDNEKMSQNSRIYGILKQLDIEQNLYNNSNLEKIYNAEIDYKKLNNKLEVLKEDAKEYLRLSLMNVTKTNKK